jgi:LysR family transcriptional regulator, flagellar master operon regulator
MQNNCCNPWEIRQNRWPMDIELARTFMAIVENGSFVRAAKRLNVTQTAVSARMRSLEIQLGRSLLTRNKAGACLTPAGEQFLQYAPTLIQIWERARHQVAIPKGHRAVLAVGIELSMWDPLLVKWLVWMKRKAPDIALRTQVEVPDGLMRRIADGVLDIAIMYRPQNLAGLTIEKLFEEKLILVSTERARRRIDPGYVYVDWGPEFAAYHGTRFPSLANPGVFVGLGPLGLGYILEVGGSGYFRQRTARPYLDSGQLFRVPNAPEFLYPAYAVYSDSADASLLDPALAGLRSIAKAEFGEAAPAKRQRR